MSFMSRHLPSRAPRASAPDDNPDVADGGVRFSPARWDVYRREFTGQLAEREGLLGASLLAPSGPP
jgi:hypothetical protein